LRICFLDEALFSRGTDAVNGSRVQILALAKELARRGHEVAVVSGSDSDARIDANVDREGIPVFRFRRSLRLPVLGASAASRAVRRYAPDVIYVRGRTYLAGVAAWERWRRRTGFIWASNAEEGCERWKHLRHLWKGPRPVIRKVLRTPPDLMADLICDLGVGRADQCVCQTQHQCARLRAVHGREGVIIRSLQAPPADLPPKAVPPLVVWVGRVSTDRAPEAFVELARSLADLDCEFALVGPASSPAYMKSLLASADGLARFRFIGEVPLSESWEWIAKASVLVNTSPVEGVSNALVQAWHCGTPTVTLFLDPDGIIERGEVGFRSGDLPTMTRQVRGLLTDAHSRESMGARALALAKSEFSGESVGTAYEAVMQRAAAAHV
jgi:glycosyltransferase involved in cell wall biosynthesis